MTKEEKLEFLKAITAGKNVEVVLEKNVEYEIGNVEAGGIGVQICHYGKPAKAEGATGARKPKKPETKIVQSVFMYRWGETLECRVIMLYQYLLKVRWIDQDTDMEQFCALFDGEDCDCKVKWTGKQSQLFYLVKVLLQKDFIRTPEGVGQWEIVQSHFLDKDSRIFGHFNKQKTPKKTAETIEQMAEILNPARTIDPRTFAEALKNITPIEEDDE